MTQYVATAAVVKVAIGSASGNRVAAFVQRGGVIPDGIAEAQIKHLIERGLITEAETESEPSPPEEIALPEGAPSAEWSAKQLDKFAQEHGIDLGAAKTKPEKVAAITAAAKE
ncbi:hypothetical protein [Mycetocola saprophilus]|uniref:hypothetical protein n=1 Tax=Mycetocola saprophilus TaxID=76636 RepID=UPI0004C1D472|nr:hypothetical protein [Mycetocola saprophilus]